MAPRLGLQRKKVWVPDLAYRMTGTLMSMPAPMLPKTTQLLEELQRLGPADSLDRLELASSDRIASYRAVPEPDLPVVRFNITEADAALLAFAGKEEPGFEVLEVFRAGFQHHWRRDLVQTFDEELPLLSRLCGLSDARELLIEHLSLPILRKGRVREIRGWLLFGDDPIAGEAARLGEIAMFRRLERSRSVRLRAGLTRPGGSARSIRGVLGGLRERWSAD